MPMQRRTWLRAWAWVGVTALLAGCSAAAGGMGGAIVALLGALTLYACVADPEPTPDPGAEAGLGDGGPSDGGAEAGRADRGPDVEEGEWEACCDDGIIRSCFCQAGTACNYDWFQDCGQGTCAYGQCEDPDVGVDQGVDAALDQGVDAGLDEGVWEHCCVDGVVDTCYCPAGDFCNYGWYEDCGDGTCTDLESMCP